MIRVIIADDHAILRDGLARLIGDEPGMTVVATAKDGAEALARAEDTAADCLLLDLALPKVPGIEVLREVARRRLRLAVVVLSQYPEDYLALHLYAIGALAYVSKLRDPQLVLDALRSAARGERFANDRLVQLERNTLHDTTQIPHATLTAREYQVFILLIEGTPVSLIAAQLDLGVSTVSNHVAAIRRKLSAESLVDVVNYAHRVGLIQ